MACSMEEDAVAKSGADIDGSVFVKEDDEGRLCPYDPNHKSSSARYGIHLEKCRMRYVDSKLREGCTHLRLSCKYNPTHQILAPELILHEQACDDKYKETVDYLFAAVYEEVMEETMRENETGEPPEEIPEEIQQKSDENLQRIIKLVHEKFQDDTIDMIKNGDKPDATVFWADPEHVFKYGKDRVFKEAGAVPTESDESAVCRRRQAIRQRRVPRDPTPYPGSEDKLDGEIEQDVKDEDDEEWTGEEPNFSWLDNQMQFRPTSFQYPPTLSWSQRKQFSKVNSDKLKYEHGFFSAEEEPAEGAQKPGFPEEFHLSEEDI